MIFRMVHKEDHHELNCRNDNKKIAPGFREWVCFDENIESKGTLCKSIHEVFLLFVFEDRIGINQIIARNLVVLLYRHGCKRR